MEYVNFPPQMLSFKKKTSKWRKQHLDWADNRTFFKDSSVRHSMQHKKINYDLVNGILHMEDIASILNPDCIDASYVPTQIQHYPIMNSKINVLRGEEYARTFDYHVLVTNPTAVSDIENKKKEELFQRIQQMISDTSQSEEEFNQELEKLNNYYTYNYQDIREIRANALLNHYWKEQNFPLLFNKGFGEDALVQGEEIYQCSIVSGEPTLVKVNPLTVSAFKAGYSSKIEDADIITIDDYWSPGKIIDTYYEFLTDQDRKYIEELPNMIGKAVDSAGNIDERAGYVYGPMISDVITTKGNDAFYEDPLHLFSSQYNNSLLPYDMEGNVRVLRVYWKSKRKIKRVKSYDPQTGQETYEFYPEDYRIDPNMGEEEKILWINEAWEGTKIGEDIYVCMRPMPIQYNVMSNPSKCSFGIVGSIYNTTTGKPYSMVDMMKPYNYLYDVIHDRLNKLMARNWGKLVKLDLAMIPQDKGWDIDTWMYYAKTMNIAVINSFNEGNEGQAKGKLAGAMNNNSNGVIDAELGNVIQQYIQILEYLKQEMSDVAGISKQREGQIANRETVGGVERATLQSSHITEWLFAIHNDLKKRVLECFLETAKIALRGRNMKFKYILPDYTEKMIEIDGDEFAENDYGLAVDYSNQAQQLTQKLDMIAQAALQNQLIDFSTIMKLYGTASLAEKQHMVEIAEQQMQQRQQEQQQQQMQLQQQQMQMQAEAAQAERDLKDSINVRDNETRVLVANIQAESYTDYAKIYSENNKVENNKEKLAQDMIQFNKKLELDIKKFEADKAAKKKDQELKEKQINIQKQNKTSK